ncbi:ABC transporter permease [Myroides odoratus]|uniref:ABC transporter permease n=1 Tax=Myroides odoratus TaxID=256 RepID=UPI0039B11962
MSKGFLSLFKEELKRMLTTPRILVLILGIPLMLFLYYGALLQEGVSRDLPVTLLDLDKSSTSRKLASFIDASSAMEIVYEVNDELEGQKTVRRGDSYALIIIPKDFQKNVQKGVKTNVTCYYNGQYLLPAGLIQRDFQTAAGYLAAGVRTITLEQGGLTPQQALASVSPIHVEEHVLFNPYTSYEYYLGLAFMPMALQIIMMVVSIYVFGVDLKYRKGKELLERANNKVWVLTTAKILPYTLIFILLGFYMNSYVFYKLSMPLKGSFFVLNVFFILFVFVCQSMAFFLASVMNSLRIALTIGGAYAAVAFSFAGYTFPPEGMSGFVRGVNYLFPFHSYMRFVVNYGIRGISFNTEQLSYLIAFALFICLGVIAMPFYYKKLQKGGYDA